MPFHAALGALGHLLSAPRLLSRGENGFGVTKTDNLRLELEVPSVLSKKVLD